MTKWIPIEYRLPEMRQSVIVGRKGTQTDIPSAMAATFDGEDFIVFGLSAKGKRYVHPTHWMPLPEPPK